MYILKPPSLSIMKEMILNLNVLGSLTTLGVFLKAHL